MKFTKKTLAILSLCSVVSPLVAMAQPVTIPGEFAPPPQYTTFQGILNLIGRIFGILQVLFFLAAAFFVLYAAFLYLTSGGDQEKVGIAKNYILYAAVAVAVALLATAVGPIVRSFLGV